MTYIAPTRHRPESWTCPRWLRLCGLAILVSFAGAAQGGQNGNSSNETFRPDKAISVSAVNQRPDANQQMEINSRWVDLRRFAAINALRKQQMDEDSARLLQFAAELNQQIANCADGGLGPEAMARASMIEKLAHAVKEKMKLTVAAP